jgi:hydrogenase expression/formation protein HypD
MTTQEQVRLIHQLADRIGRPLQLMEVCGTHTVSAFRSGLRSLLPAGVSLIAGPGCPVCVTPNPFLDRAIAVAHESGTAVATFGDMMRVPGTHGSLETARAGGCDIRAVYSPSDALKAARASPETRVVFLGVGFETTAPAVAWTIREAARAGVRNYSVLCGHKTMPFAMEALLRERDVEIDGFLCPGHVSIVIGARAYTFIATDFGIPCVVAGFEAADMLSAVRMLLEQVDGGAATVQIQYTRGVTEDGNLDAQNVMREVFDEDDAEWRGLGNIPRSGLSIREEFAQHDAERVFSAIQVPEPAEPSGCICGDILKGKKRPTDCPLFRTRCTPSSPVGACMVSGEGTCAAFFKYHKGQD